MSRSAVNDRRQRFIVVAEELRDTAAAMSCADTRAVSGTMDSMP
ncbi:hypothetical protein QA802_35585 [Streptomyces sp. B21-105]